MLNSVNCLPKRLRIQRFSVTDTAEICYGNRVAALAKRHYVGACCCRFGVNGSNTRKVEEEKEKEERECEVTGEEKHLLVCGGR